MNRKEWIVFIIVLLALIYFLPLSTINSLIISGIVLLFSGRNLIKISKIDHMPADKQFWLSVSNYSLLVISIFTFFPGLISLLKD